MANDHGDGLAHELPERASFLLDVEPMGAVPALDGVEQPSGSPDGTDRLESLDPIRLYLRQASRSRLLDREEESTLAQRIALARRERAAAVLGSPIGLRWILGLPAGIRDETLRLDDVLADRADDGDTAVADAIARRRLLRQVARIRGLLRGGGAPARARGGDRLER